MRILRSVHGLRDPETRKTVSFAAGADVPDWVREQVTNPAAWENSPSENPPSLADGTIDDVKDRVGDDPALARAALDAEQARDGGPRSTLVAHLERIAAEE